MIESEIIPINGRKSFYGKIAQLPGYNSWESLEAEFDTN